jgi:5-methylcytosine-specific restriction endonuclease McrA
MRSRSQLSDQALLDGLATRLAMECTNTAGILADLAEIDARRLYLPAGYDSMFSFCVGQFHMSEDVAYKRIKAARAARRFPAILEAVATGRLHLSAVVLLAPHLTEHTAEELLAAATHRTKAEIERLLAERFPQPDLMAWVEAIPQPALSTEQQAPGPVESQVPGSPAAREFETQQAPGPVRAPVTPPAGHDRGRVKPLAPQRFAVQFTVSQSAHDKLRYVQELLGHQVPSGDIAQVFEWALDALIPQLEKRKFAATTTPRPSRPRSQNERCIPAHVRRAVWKRDAGQCTFVSETGHRCDARKPLEFDHVLEIVRGGEASVDDLRLRCRAHNQYAAERTLGAEFMLHKRVAASAARAGTAPAASTTAPAPGS